MARASDRLRRWASLSALASAALTVSAGSGEATIIYHPTNGFTVPGSLPLPGGNSILLNRTHSRFSSEQSVDLGNRRAAFELRTGSSKVTARGAAFKAAGGFLAVTKKGQTFNMVGTRVTNHPLIGSHRYLYARSVGTVWFPSPEGPERDPAHSRNWLGRNILSDAPTRRVTDRITRLFGSRLINNRHGSIPQITTKITRCSALTWAARQITGGSN